MPLENCSLGDGKSQGWRWGQSGKCYLSKKDALKQGIAIEKPTKFKKIMEHDKTAALYFGDRDTLLMAKAVYNEYQKENANSFIKSIATFLSSNADDGQNGSNVNRSGMLDNENDKSDEKDDCTVGKYIDNAGENSSNDMNGNSD